MMSFHEMRLRHDEKVNLPTVRAKHAVTLRCLVPEGLRPANLVIESAGGLLAQLPNFVPLVLRERSTTGERFDGTLACIVDDGDDAFAILIGDQNLVRVDLTNRAVACLCQLNRGDKDDRGFYRSRVFLLGHTAVMIYEGGAIRISETGCVKWHVHTSWDDVYERHDDKHLYYWSEFGEHAADGFTIDIETGKTAPRKSGKVL